MIKIVFIFLLSLCIASLAATKNFRSRTLFSKSAVNLIAVLALGSTKNLDDGSIQTMAFLLIPTGLMFCFLWLSLGETGVDQK
jgi:hypothetical protein